MILKNRLTLFYFIFYFVKKLIKFYIKIKDQSTYQNLDSIEKKFEKLIKDNNKNKKKNKKIVLICLNNFELYFLVIWIYLCIKLYKSSFDILVVTDRNNIHINKLVFSLKIKIVYVEDILKTKSNLSKKTILIFSKIKKSNNFKEFSQLKYDGFEVGKMVISNFCRIHKVGFVNFESKIQNFLIKKTAKDFIVNYEKVKSNKLWLNSKMMFTFEKNLSYYLHFFLASIQKQTEVIHWSGSNLDEKTFILRKYNRKNIYLHHSSLEKKNWKNIKRKKLINKDKFLIKKTFNDRYSGKLAPFSVNLIECGKLGNNKKLKISKKNKKLNCIIFSHILHDTLYFFGDEIYSSYAHWLLRTTELACKNPKINWYIKFHPSNIYRNEFKKGKSKEEDLIRQHIKKIPKHVKFIYPDTKINPLEWMNFADFGVTIRGTAGLEMSVLGKPVITCGSNRYEKKGFTLDPKNKSDYEDRISKLPKFVESREPNFQILAEKFYHSIFFKKAFQCDFVSTKLNSEKFSWNEIKFDISKKLDKSKSVVKFNKFILSKNEEFLN